MNNLTSKEFENQVNKQSACILPVGAYEQHGPHDILETDFVIADYMAKKIYIRQIRHYYILQI